jgi:T5SS/PEP-CTERM-associated repeat protein
MTLTGTGTKWTNSAGALLIGDKGTGTLNVLSGALFLSDADVSVGSASGSGGNVLVDAGTWTITGSLDIGIVGTGVVTIQDGGLLTAGSITVGPNGTLIDDPIDSGRERGFHLRLRRTPDARYRGNGARLIDGFAPQAGETFDLINDPNGVDLSAARIEIEGLEPGFDYTEGFANGEWTLTASNDGVSDTPKPNSAWLSAGALSALLLAGASRKVFARRRLWAERGIIESRCR